MKKLFFLTSVFLISAAFVSAQSQTYYTLHPVGKENSPYYTFYKIDRAAKKFYFDSDSPSDANMLMKNYKKAGAKETFDLYPEIDPSVKIFAVEFSTDTVGQQVITFSVDNKVTESYVVGTDEQQEAYSKKQQETDNKQNKTAPTKTQTTSESASDPAPAEKAESQGTEPQSNESGVKKTINKGLSVFKKKK